MCIKIKDITKSFKAKRVLEGLTFQVERGEIFGILGPNGAGKTTLLSIIATILLPDSGSVEIFGIDAIKDPYKVRRVLNIASGHANFPWSLTVYEVLRYYGMLWGLYGKQLENRIDEMIDILKLDDFRDVKFEGLSTGTKQKLAIAKSLVTAPKIILLDEPTVGLDPDVSVAIRKYILQLKKEKGKTILLTTHYMAEAEMLCDEVIFLKSGKIAMEVFPKRYIKGLESLFLEVVQSDTGVAEKWIS